MLAIIEIRESNLYDDHDQCLLALLLVPRVETKARRNISIVPTVSAKPKNDYFEKTQDKAKLTVSLVTETYKKTNDASGTFLQRKYLRMQRKQPPSFIAFSMTFSQNHSSCSSYQPQGTAAFVSLDWLGFVSPFASIVRVM